MTGYSTKQYTWMSPQLTVTETEKTALTTGGNSHRVPVRVKETMNDSTV